MACSTTECDVPRGNFIDSKYQKVCLTVSALPKCEIDCNISTSYASLEYRTTAVIENKCIENKCI